jgi:hypothetical protein
MSMRAESADCPKDKGVALRFSRSAPFKCRRCGHEFTKPKANKYNAKKPPPQGDKKFDSLAEARYLMFLQLRQKVGEIMRIRWKPKYEVAEDVPYTPEATFYDIALASDISADVKAGPTKKGRFPTICRLWRTRMDHPLIVVESERGTGRWKTTRTITPKRKDPNP